MRDGLHSAAMIAGDRRRAEERLECHGWKSAYHMLRFLVALHYNRIPNCMLYVIIIKRCIKNPIDELEHNDINYKP